MNFLGVSAIVLVFAIVEANAQEKTTSRLAKFGRPMPANISPDEGSIILKDGNQLEGMVSFESGRLKLVSEGKSRTLNSSEVAGFEVYDPSFDGMRIFYSLPKEDALTGKPNLYFYELVEDFNSFSVLIANDQADIKSVNTDRTYWSSPSPGSVQPATPYTVKGDGYVSIKQVETIYLLRPTGNPEPLFSTIVETSSREKLIGDGESTKTKFLNKDLLQEYMGKHYESVKAYARANGYSLKDKSEFLKILAYYQTLID